MNFQFSIRAAIKESWNIFLTKPWFFIALAFVTVILNIAGVGEHSWWYQTLVIIASLIWSYVWLSVALAAVDDRQSMLTYQGLALHLPNFRQFFALIGVGILFGLFTVAGFIALIIPGIYILVRLTFSNLAFVDRQEGVMKSLRYSWHLVKGDIFWTVLLTMIASWAIIIAGMIALFVGIFVALPISMILIAKLYRALTLNHGVQTLVVQPEEIESHDVHEEHVVIDADAVEVVE